MDGTSRQSTQQRRRHALRLSSDSSTTYTSLPAYSSARSVSYSDKPPDYHQSADDADCDLTTDDDEHAFAARTPTSPLRKRHSHQHSRRASSAQQQQQSTDPYLDSLLERSVHALELSNVLLQSTINTRSNLSASMAHDRILDRNLELSATFLNNRIRDSSAAQDEWMDDLEDVVRDVRDLYGDNDSISRSLPTGSGGGASPPPIHALAARASHRRRSSNDQQHDRRPRIRLSHSPPSSLRDYMGPPPRAMTQYVSVSSSQGDASESTADSESIYMPSTIGLQSTAHLSSFRSTPTPSRTHRRPDTLRMYHSNASTPGFIEHGYGHREPSYDWNTSHRRHRSGVTSPRSGGSSRASVASPSRHSFEVSSDSHRRSAGSRGRGVYTGTTAFQQGGVAMNRSRSLSDSRGHSRSRSSTPSHPDVPSLSLLHTPVLPPMTRPMTPPQEESPPEGSESSDNNSPPNVARTVESLRKILDEASPSRSSERDKPHSAPPAPQRVPAFLLPRSPSVTPLAGTSTATASVSRLFTRGTHSTRDEQPARPSLKLGGNSPRDSMSAPSSGRSTPRQVAFAQLPEPYSAEGTRRGFDKPKVKDARGKGKGKEDEKKGGWWNMLFSMTPATTGAHSAARMEDRVEDRMARSWARTGSGQATLEDFLY